MVFSWLQKLLRRRTLLESCGRTDTGRVRANNEDAFAILVDRNLFMVADGMGGHNAGEVASRIAIESLADYFSVAALNAVRGKGEQIHHLLISGLRHANEQVISTAAADQALQGMGCTLVVAFIDGQTLHTCHVGDARCYRTDGDTLVQITTDHTLMARVEAAARNNGQGEATRTVNRHVVTRAIGFPFQEDPEYHACPISAGCRVLLCSDGLWSMVDDQRLLAILAETNSPERASEILIREANEAGGKDNITAVVVHC